MGLKKRNKVSAEFNMSSLTDIIFLLLIFFMLTSTLVSPNALNLKLPGSSSKTVAPSTISVSVDTDRNFYLKTDRINPDDLIELLKAEIAKEKNREDVTLVINTDKSVPIEDVVKVMDAAYKLQIKAILATDPD
ncbi:MAG: biopolymer transport protein ExbD [Cognaticolwellia sp.]|jgi:biopolymer transport protein ExbD